MFISRQPLVATFLLVVSVFLIEEAMANNGEHRFSGDFFVLRGAVQTYKLTTGILPDPEEGLQSLVARPASLSRDREWIRLLEEVPMDPWGKQYIYVAGIGYPDGFGFYSTGLDGVSASQGNDPDDWNSWSDDHRGIDVGLGQHGRLIGLMIAGVSAFGFLAGHLAGRKRKKAGQSVSC